MIELKIGYTWLIFFLLLILKLCGVITWSWWWITFPVWGALAVSLTGIVVCNILSMILGVLK
jgi:hypothetical protein